MNIRNTTAKERMLKKIRQALLHKRENPATDFEDAPLYVQEEEPLDVVFAKALTKSGGHFVYCESEINLIENLIDFVETNKVSKLAVYESGLGRLLGHYGFPFVGNSVALKDVEVGVTSCECLVARNGSVLISSASESGRTLAVFPPTHLVIAKASQLVMDVKEALVLVRDRYGERLPSLLSLVTGPSKSKLLDTAFSKGGVGPQHLYVFVLEDRF